MSALAAFFLEQFRDDSEFVGEWLKAKGLDADEFMEIISKF